MTLADGIQALIAQYGADTVAAAVALMVPSTLECKRCDHTWTPRGTGTPRQCPACHSQGWQTPPAPRPFAVVVAYDCKLGERGTVLSRHAKYPAARDAARRTGFDEFLRIADSEEA